MAPFEAALVLRLGVRLARSIPLFAVWCRVMAGSFPRSGGALCEHLQWLSEDISRGIASGSSIRDIAKDLLRAAPTASREVARHGGRPLYRAHEADQQAWESALRPKACLLAMHVKLQRIVASKLLWDWSPEQISGWLKFSIPAQSLRVSAKRFTAAYSLDTRGVLKKELLWAPAIADVGVRHSPALAYLRPPGGVTVPFTDQSPRNQNRPFRPLKAAAQRTVTW